MGTLGDRLPAISHLPRVLVEKFSQENGQGLPPQEMTTPRSGFPGSWGTPFPAGLLRHSPNQLTKTGKLQGGNQPGTGRAPGILQDLALGSSASTSPFPLHREILTALDWSL